MKKLLFIILIFISTISFAKEFTEKEKGEIEKQLLVFQDSIVNQNHKKINSMIKFPFLYNNEKVDTIESATSELLEIEKIPFNSFKIGEEYKTETGLKCMVTYESEFNENNIIIKENYNISVVYQATPEMVKEYAKKSCGTSYNKTVYKFEFKNKKLKLTEISH
ncbi:MAG: hypothetical protein KBF12_12615 [Sebaldella sp.]|nr:hypothetical protein [Sebaldella sp.]